MLPISIYFRIYYDLYFRTRRVQIWHPPVTIFHISLALFLISVKLASQPREICRFNCGGWKENKRITLKGKEGGGWKRKKRRWREFREGRDWERKRGRLKEVKKKKKNLHRGRKGSISWWRKEIKKEEQEKAE